MFGIGATELLVILVLAAIFLGPEKMIELAGQLGRWVAKLRAETSDISREFRDAFDLELGDLKQEVNEVKHDIEGLKDVRAELASPLQEPHTQRSAARGAPGGRPVYNLPTPGAAPATRAASSAALLRGNGQAPASAAAATVAEPSAALEEKTALANAATAAPVELAPEPEIVRDLSPNAEPIEISVGVLVGEDDEAEPLVLDGPVLMEDPYAEAASPEEKRDEAPADPGEEV